MSGPTADEIDDSSRELDNPELERFRRIELVRRLLKHRTDQRIGPILKKLLETEKDPEVLKTVVLGIGFLKDRSVIPLLLPFIEHPKMRVCAAAIKSLCRVDPNMEVQTLHPLLTSRDDKSRLAAVLALMSSNPRLGSEMLTQLAHSPTESLRHTAVRCLETVEVTLAQALVVEMFVAETKMAVLKDIARAIKKRGVSREGLEGLNTYRAQLKASHPADDDQSALRDAKLKIMDRLARRSYEKLDLSAGTIGTLEGQVDKQATSLEVRAAELTRQKDEQRRTGQAQKLTAKKQSLSAGPRWGRAVVGLMGIMALAAGAHFAFKSEPPPPVQLAAPVKVELPSTLGKAGERVSVEGEVLHVYTEQRSVAMMVQGSVMICAVFLQGVPPAALTGAKVRLEGTIQNVESKDSLTVRGDTLLPAS